MEGSFDLELWERLEAFEIDQEDAEFRFSDRLAIENGWSLEYTARVIDEYKRFVYLCRKVEHRVSPSEAVDQVWHLHLCYTRSYWEDLCGEVLGVALHHGPTRGGSLEREKFVDWYSRTLESYREHFGVEPPAEIWPGVGERFSGRFRRVNTVTDLVIPRRRIYLGVGSVAVGALLAGCGSMLLAETDLTLFVVICVVFVLLAFLSGRGKGGGKGGGCGSGCGGDSGCGGGCGGD